MLEKTMNLDDRFQQYHHDNPHVFPLFVRFTLEAKKRGFKNFGAKAVFERIRWHMNFETIGDPFKINNSYTALYVRLLESEHPEFIGFYRKRRRG